MENEKMIAVFSELLENQKEIARSQREIMGVFQELKNQMEGIKSGMKNQKIDPAPLDIKPIQQTIERGIADIRFLAGMSRQKSASNNLRVFLESDAKKWAVYLLVAITFLTYLYWFVIHK